MDSITRSSSITRKTFHQFHVEQISAMAMAMGTGWKDTALLSRPIWVKI